MINMKTIDIASKLLRKVTPVINFSPRANIKQYLKNITLTLSKKTYKCIICGIRISEDNIGMILSDGKKLL